PIDPGMLVKAMAAGLDPSSIVSGVSQPFGPVRCAIMIQKALELCAEVRGLGNSLLAALDKGDAEHLALVRQRHEIQIQQMAQDVGGRFRAGEEGTGDGGGFAAPRGQCAETVPPLSTAAWHQG